MERRFYYLECEDLPKLYRLLDKQVYEGYIIYEIDEIDGFIIIDNLMLDDDDPLFSRLESMDLIEDMDARDVGADYDDYDDFYNNDDI